jgi:hypothetical protein
MTPIKSAVFSDLPVIHDLAQDIANAYGENKAVQLQSRRILIPAGIIS